MTSSGRTQQRKAPRAPPDEIDIPSMVPYRFDTPKPKQAPKVTWSPDFDANTGTAGTYASPSSVTTDAFDRTTFSELEYSGLMPSKSLMEMQRVANAERRAAVTASRPENLTLRRALADVYDAVFVAWEDISKSTADAPASLWAVFSKRDRLRGLGLALAALAVGGLVIESAYE